MFKKNKDGIWDSENCYECCMNCSDFCGKDCPLDFEGTCDNCIFKDGYKKHDGSLTVVIKHE